MSQCRHCNVKEVNRPRGLCYPCYRDHGIRDLYPSTSKFAPRDAFKDFNGKGKQPKPTAALPGTPEKMAELEARVAGRFRLHSPQDAQRDYA